MNKLIKIDRISAWVLFVSMLLYFVTGYGMTKGIISQELASNLHLNYLTYIVLVSFVFHTFFAIHLAFKRWHIWNGFGKSILTLFYLFFIFFFIYIDQFYQPDDKQVSSVNQSDTSQTSNQNLPNNQTDSNQSNSAVSETKTFTEEELAKYNGQNGNEAYVAVDGDVYDLTSVFNGGSHYSHFAGKELTNAFYTRHAKNALSKYPIVGVMK